MFERYTDRARRVITLAQEEAREFKHNYIGTEHILLGLLHEGEGIAAQALSALGVSLEGARSQIEEMIGQGQQVPPGHIPFTPRAKKVLDLSLREALQLGHSDISTEHLLLALIREGEGAGPKALMNLGIESSTMRQRVIELLSGYERPEPSYVQKLLARELQSVRIRIAQLKVELTQLETACEDIESHLSTPKQAEAI